MFFLATIHDRINISPSNFRKSFSQAIIDELDQKYCDKILDSLGLCISTFDVLESSTPFVNSPGNGGMLIKVKFRLIVFRPSIGEVIGGKIKSCNRNGLVITVGFFSDIFVPPELLPENTW
jgi:DNA-directed RNA polymerase III subunit RPC8